MPVAVKINKFHKFRNIFSPNMMLDIIILVSTQCTNAIKPFTVNFLAMF